ncbi:MAG: hypothetical protein JSR25_06605 [Proteobacteria bacterium]|nr:hypothetical protein [Pseudomonadota bacterium]
MKEASGMAAISQNTALPAWVKFAFHTVPLPIMDMALRGLISGLVRRHPELVERMGPYVSTTFLIEPTDLPIQFRLRLNRPASIACQRRPTLCAWDARVAGPIGILVAMVHGALDGDALFFSRDITIEGDTDAILAMRNAIDAAEIDLTCEVANLFGPLSPVAKIATQAAMPVMDRLFGVTASRWKGHAI